MAHYSAPPERLSGWPKRAHLLFGVVLELAGEHELPAVLRRIVDAAAVADARYAALGV